jgi:hypothetical protein
MGMASNQRNIPPVVGNDLTNPQVRVPPMTPDGDIISSDELDLSATSVTPKVPTATQPFEAQKAGWSHTVGPDQAKSVEQYIVQRMQEGVPEDQIKKEVSAKFAPKLASGPIAQAQQNVPTPSRDITVKSARQLTMEDETAKKQVVEIDNTSKTLSDLRTMNQSIYALKSAAIEGGTTYGPAHELLNKFGGYLNYIDPDSTLAKMARNDAPYFGNMMDLTRDKIQALGAGTAVSNLDLIVTQKSVGDLRNDPEGNKKLFALMEFHNALLADKLEQKMNYWNSSDNPDLNKFKATDGMTHRIKAVPKANGKFEYELQSKEEFINEMEKRGYKREDLEKDFDRQAYASVRALFKRR